MRSNWRNGDRRKRVAEALHTVRLDGLDDRKPGQLSGGQQQRVALARALAFNPDLVLLDEPLSNLDAKLREHVRLDLRDIQRRTGLTTIFVTHDQVEALVMSDTIVLMNQGRIEQVGAPADLYAHPATEFAARFIGGNNLYAGTFACEDSSGTTVRLDGLAAPLSGGTRSAGSWSVGCDVWACVRPEQTVILDPESATEPTLTGTSLPARVVDVIYQGASVLVDVTVEGLGTIRADRPESEVAGLGPGSPVTIQIADFHVVPRETEATAET